VSLIGTLEQVNLSSILQRVETHSKTGLLIIKQGVHWVEFYFREGRLICIGPVRTNANLGERLLQDGMISPQALRQALQSIGSDQPGETRLALALMDLRLVEHKDFRAWSTRKAVDVLRVLLTWSSGEIHFQEEVQPPADRLLVGLSVSTLLSSMPVQSARTETSSHVAQGQSGRAPHTPPPDVARLPTLMSASQFFLETPPPAPSLPATESLSTLPPASSQMASEPISAASLIGETPAMSEAPSFSAPSMPSFSVPAPVVAPSMPSFSAPPSPTTESLTPSFSPTTGSLSSIFDDADDSDLVSNSGPSRPEPVMNPVPPKRIDTSFMRPEMILMPADLVALREQNPPIQLTPDQWRLLTRIDGRTSLQTACQELSAPPALLCQIAGELIAEGLIQLLPPGVVPAQVSELSPVSNALATSGLSNGYVAPGYAATTASPWSPALPTSDVLPQNSSMPFETESQWGNGGNGATFIPGRGWIATPQPLQPLHSSGPLATQSGVYAQVK